jgi:hypothetical protein
MDATQEPKKSRSLEPSMNLRTIPSGWDMSGFYAASENWVNEPQNMKETTQPQSDEDHTAHDETTHAV